MPLAKKFFKDSPVTPWPTPMSSIEYIVAFWSGLQYQLYLYSSSQKTRIKKKKKDINAPALVK